MSKYLDDVGVKYLWARTKAHVAEEITSIKNEFGSVYSWKGSVDTLAELKAIPESELRVGDVYNVKESGMNYAWTGEKDSDKYDEGWDPLAGIIEIPTLTTEDIDKLLGEGI